MFEIEKGVPLPEGVNAKYPFRQMEIGDSFFSEHKRVIDAAGQATRRHGMKFSIRKVDGGYRCWRVA